jgi:hypothetical protein
MLKIQGFWGMMLHQLAKTSNVLKTVLPSPSGSSSLAFFHCLTLYYDFLKHQEPITQKHSIAP